MGVACVSAGASTIGAPALGLCAWQRPARSDRRRTRALAPDTWRAQGQPRQRPPPPTPTLSEKPLVFDRWSTTRPGVPTTTCGRLASAIACTSSARRSSSRQGLVRVRGARKVPDGAATAAAGPCRQAARPLPRPQAAARKTGMCSRARLRHHVDAAHQHRAAHANARAQRLKLLRNLDRQLASGAEHQRKQRLRLVQQRLRVVRWWGGWGGWGGAATGAIKAKPSEAAGQPRQDSRSGCCSPSWPAQNQAATTQAA